MKAKGSDYAVLSFLLTIGSYRYCCQGIFCPDCDLRISMTIFDNEYLINSSETMNCGERSFKISLEADVEPGDYPIQASLIHPDTILPGLNTVQYILVTRRNILGNRILPGGVY